MLHQPSFSTSRRTLWTKNCCSKPEFWLFAPATWDKHPSALREFLEFCDSWEVSPFECTPSVVNLFMLHAGQKRKPFGYIERFTSALSFFYRFFLVRNELERPVLDVKKFMEKVCQHNVNKKDAFCSAEVRKIWDKIDTHGGILKLPKRDLRTFVLAVFQHKTFCRFSDAAAIKLSEVLHTVDYFKIKISCSKTDQAGKGQEVFLPMADSP